MNTKGIIAKLQTGNLQQIIGALQELNEELPPDLAKAATEIGQLADDLASRLDELVDNIRTLSMV